MSKTGWLIMGIVGLSMLATGIIVFAFGNVDERAFCEERVKQYWPEYDVIKSTKYYGDEHYDDECIVRISKGQLRRDGLILQEYVETETFVLTGDAKEYVRKDDNSNTLALAFVAIGVLAAMIGFHEWEA